MRLASSPNRLDLRGPSEDPRLVALAQEAGCTLAQLALTCLGQRPVVCSAIASSVRQLEANLGAAAVGLAAAAPAQLDEFGRPLG